MTTKAYLNHRSGSRKGAVHKTYNEKGADAAFAHGKRLKLKDSTLIQDISTWRAAAKRAQAERASKRSDKRKRANGRPDQHVAH